MWGEPLQIDPEYQISANVSWDPLDDFWYSDPGTYSATGQRVTADSSLRVATVMACVRIIAEAEACLPMFVFRQLANGGKKKAADHPLFLKFHTRRGMPNRWQTAQEYREMKTAHMVLRGNAYSEIRNFGSEIDELIPFHPDIVTVEQLENRRLRYQVHDGYDKRTISQDQMFHLRGLSLDGVMGINPIAYARNAIGLAVAAETHGANLFNNGAKPGGVLEHPGKLDEPAARRLRADWESMHAGAANAGRTAVLEGGMKYHEVGMTSEDAQFLESRQFQVIEICRIFRVPPHMVYDLMRATFSNIEHQGLEFVQYSLMPWLVRWEAGITKSLIADDDTYFAEHVVDGLQRGDTQSRYGSYATARQWGWLSINEIRSLENMNPIEDGDTHLQPLNMEEAGTPRPDPEEATEPEPQENRAKTVLALDAAERIANAEIRELSKRIDKASEDRSRFNEWVAQLFAKHGEYVSQVLSPLVEAFGGESASEIAERICAAGFRLVVCADPDATLEEWKQKRKWEIKNLIEKGLGQ